jgi:hypothetical protein
MGKMEGPLQEVEGLGVNKKGHPCLCRTSYTEIHGSYEGSTRTTPPSQWRRFQLTLEISARARNFWIARCLASRSVASISLELIVATTTETGFAWRKDMGGDSVVVDEVGVVMT